MTSYTLHHGDCLDVYAQRLPAMRNAARTHGYALALHGSGERDCDLIAVPWISEASKMSTLIEALRVAADGVIVGAFDGNLADLPPYGDYMQRNPEPKPHGRYAWSIQIGNGRYFDVSVMPRLPDASVDAPQEARW